MKSSEVLALSNLGDFRIGEGYLLELEHGLMGTFPALISKTGDPFFCLDRGTIEKAILLLSRRAFRIEKILLLINEKKKIAFCLTAFLDCWGSGHEAASAPIITEEDLQGMKIGDLKWASGLIGNDMTPAEFEETPRLALAKIEKRGTS